MIKSFLSLFRKLTPLDLVKQELAEQERELVKNQQTVAFFQHSVNYNLERIEALRSYLAHPGNFPAKVTTPAKRSESRRQAPLAAAAA